MRLTINDQEVLAKDVEIECDEILPHPLPPIRMGTPEYGDYPPIERKPHYRSFSKNLSTPFIVDTVMFIC